MLTPIDFIICIVGWLIFNIFMLKNDKTKFDEIDQKFSLGHYATLTWDDWIFTLSASIGLLYVTPNNIILPEPLALVPIAFIKGAFGGIMFQGLYEVIKISIEKIKNKFK